MDPNEALTNLRLYAQAVLLAESDSDDCDLLAATFTALDEWLSRGGFFPAAWCSSAH